MNSKEDKREQASWLISTIITKFMYSQIEVIKEFEEKFHEYPSMKALVYAYGMFIRTVSEITNMKTESTKDFLDAGYENGKGGAAIWQKAVDMTKADAEHGVNVHLRKAGEPEDLN